MPTVTLPVVSAFTAGLLIVGQMLLMFAVTRVRRSAKVSLGDGGNPALESAIRRHGNYAENAAIFIAGLTLLEMLGATRPLVVSLAVAFIAARILHAIGLSRSKSLNAWRFAGAVTTIVTEIALGVRLITVALPHLALTP